MAEYDDRAFNAMQNGTKTKADNIAGSSKDFSWETFYEKGDSLYSVYADKSIPQYDPDYPGISMFDEKGQETSEYKKEYKETYGKDKSASGVIGQTPRQAHFRRQFRDLEEGMDTDQQKTFFKSSSLYGDFMQPKYSKSDKLMSPYKLSKIHAEETSGKDWKDVVQFNKDVYNPYIKGLKTK
jgi:hypothetical protein